MFATANRINHSALLACAVLLWPCWPPPQAWPRKPARVPQLARPLPSDANGAPPPLAEAYAKRFTGKYAYHLVSGGIGHNRPQEAPEAFVNAVLDAEHL